MQFAIVNPFGLVSEALKGRTVAQLKERLKSKDFPITGKKADLVERAIENISENELLATGLEQIKQFDPDGYRKSSAQDKQIKMVQDADKKY